jgi:hypothetical protein
LENSKTCLVQNQKPEESKQDEEAIQSEPTEVEQPSVSPAKGQLGKLKNLFSKTK